MIVENGTEDGWCDSVLRILNSFFTQLSQWGLSQVFNLEFHSIPRLSKSSVQGWMDDSHFVQFKVDLHKKTDFDVDFRELSSRTGHMSWKISYRFTESIQWADISAVEVTVKLRIHPTSIDEGTTIVIRSCMNFCYFKSRPLDTPRNPIWWLISKPYLHSEISIGIPIYRGHNSKNWPVPILVYGQQD